MLFKILFIISFISAYGFRNKRQLYKTIIYDKYFNDKDYGSEFDLEMSEDEKNLHKDITKEENKFYTEQEEERNKYIQEVIILQKYQTMYKLLKYLLDNKLNNFDKINLLNIFKNKIDNKFL
jgi:hypothetical protein